MIGGGTLDLGGRLRQRLHLDRPSKRVTCRAAASCSALARRTNEALAADRRISPSKRPARKCKARTGPHTHNCRPYNRDLKATQICRQPRVETVFQRHTPAWAVPLQTLQQ